MNQIEFENLKQLIDALSNETRRSILDTLYKQPGGVTVGVLADLTGSTQPAVTHHLKNLEAVGLATRDSNKKKPVKITNAGYYMALIKAVRNLNNQINSFKIKSNAEL